MKKLLKTAALTGGILFAVKGLDNRIEVTHYDISSPKIPEGFDENWGLEDETKNISS
mgnify:CR=1 FL=1